MVYKLALLGFQCPTGEINFSLSLTLYAIDDSLPIPLSAFLDSYQSERGENCRCFHRLVIYFRDELPPTSTSFVSPPPFLRSFYTYFFSLPFSLSLSLAASAGPKRKCHVSLKAFARARVCALCVCMCVRERASLAPIIY